ncbi:MAG: homoserine O-acetyltransferase [Chloroherpetonaceae bacterium]|nr:homoserine O-acetyltransferase [Chloroherpetonaceae bacterium]
MDFSRHISPQTKFFTLQHPLMLESGEVLPAPTVAFRTWGKLSASKDNAILLCHGLTGSADADDWWKPLIAENAAFNPVHDFIIATNVLGSCYGTTGPCSLNPKTQKRYQADFPRITIRDMVALQARLLDELGIKSLKMVVGGSLGGMQVLEWGAMFPNRVRALIPIATSGRHSAWCIGIGEAERAAIIRDPKWNNGFYDERHPPTDGLSTARMIAMITYRTSESFTKRFGREMQDSDRFRVESYLHYQGEKLNQRFDANTYITLTKAMDTHDLGRGRASYEAALGAISHPALVVSITSDILYVPSEQAELARLMPNAELRHLESDNGHDAFLIDMIPLSDMIREFRAKYGI